MRTATHPTRTSASDRLRVDTVLENARGGRLGITFAPGKRGPGIGCIWNRDLPADLDRLVALGTNVLCVLLPEEEMVQLGIAGEIVEAERRGLAVHHLPIVDGDVPKDLDAFDALVEHVAAHLESGRHIVVHCKGGLGRAGMVAACTLLRVGVFQTVRDAIAEVRRCRSASSIENRWQEDFVAAYAVRLTKEMCERSPSLRGSSHVGGHKWVKTGPAKSQRPRRQRS